MSPNLLLWGDREKSQAELHKDGNFGALLPKKSKLPPNPTDKKRGPVEAWSFTGPSLFQFHLLGTVQSMILFVRWVMRRLWQSALSASLVSG